MHSEHLEMWEGLFKLEVGGVEQDLIPKMRQMKLTSVSAEGWIIDPDIHSLLDGPCNVHKWGKESRDIL